MQFDRNNDQQLSQAELNAIASAVISELQSRHPPGQSCCQQPRHPQRSGSMNRSQPSLEQVFVSRAMTFDGYNDGTLSAVRNHTNSPISNLLAKSILINKATEHSLQAYFPCFVFVR